LERHDLQAIDSRTAGEISIVVTDADQTLAMAGSA
jgi:hypothetical protein